MTDTLSTKRRRYAVMPFTVDMDAPEVITRWGIRDLMMHRGDYPWSRLPDEFVWCKLPDDRGRLGMLTFDSPGAATEWIRRCRMVRQRQGGPAFWMPSGWWDANPMTRARVRTYADPWEDLPCDSPLVSA
jgi:hypothetical protein